MSISVDFYNFTKDRDSTKQPTGAPAAALTCEIFNPCSVVNPRIVVKTAAPKPTNGNFYNYCYISDFKRYYYVTDWQYDNGLWIASLACDVLSTYKTQIGAENLFILRASAASNGYIKDAYYPMTGQLSRSAELLDTPAYSFSSGVYVVNVVGMNTGTSTLYQFTPNNFSTFLDGLLGFIDNFSFVDVYQAVKNSIFNPIRYITSVMWFPQGFPVLKENDSPKLVDVNVGLWQSGARAYLITNPTQIEDYQTITLPKHPQENRGKYLDIFPYTEYRLEYDPFGVIELDASQCMDAATADVTVYADALTGLGLLKVRASNGNILASVSTQYGVPLPLTGASVGNGSISGTISTVGGLIAGAITGNAAMIAGAAVSGIDTAADAIRGTVATIGSAGSITSHWQPKIFHAIFHYITGEYNAKNGRPYMQQTTPATLTGFMIAQRGDVAIPGTAAEAEQIKAFLESGFYYE